jgi:integrase
VPELPVERTEIDYLRLDEIERYLEACVDHYRPLAEFLIATGARISEALAVRWTDVTWRLASFASRASARGMAGAPRRPRASGSDHSRLVRSSRRRSATWPRAARARGGRRLAVPLPSPAPRSLLAAHRTDPAKPQDGP